MHELRRWTENQESVEMKTDKELKQLALDMFKCNVFTDRHIKPNEQDLLPSIFMPFFFMNKEQSEEFAKRDIGMLYEYMDKAGPRSINGYPIFFSFQVLEMSEIERLLPMVDALNEMTKIE